MRSRFSTRNISDVALNRTPHRTPQLDFGCSFGRFRISYGQSLGAPFVSESLQFTQFRTRRIRMSYRISILLAVVLSVPAFAQEHSHHPAKPATLMSGLGNLHHPVSTSNLQAQRFFDQGLRLIYAFN